jgi:hypothetical protein
MTGSSSDDWIYEYLVTHSHLIALTYRQYGVIAHLRHLQHTVAHALGFSVSTSRLPVTALDTEATADSHFNCHT